MIVAPLLTDGDDVMAAAAGNVGFETPDDVDGDDELDD